MSSSMAENLQTTPWSDSERTVTCRLLILADDLTGACDAAASVCEVLGPIPIAVLPTAVNDSVLRNPCAVVNAGTRGMRRKQAAERICAAVDRSHQSVERVFKKIDSSMKGHVGAEIVALLEAWPATTAFVCPANPLHGRVVRQGLLHLRESEGVIDIAAALRAQTSLPVQSLTVAEQVFPNNGRFQRVIGTTPGLFVFDAETPEDLAAWVATTEEFAGSNVLAGSSALAKAYAGSIFSREPVPEPAGRPELRGPLVLLIGSTNATTLNQLARLQQRFECCVHDARNGDPPVNWNGQSPLVLRVEYGVLLPVAIARLTDWLANRNGGVLLVSGGDTAAALCESASATRLTAWGELADGLVHCSFANGGLQAWQLVTKPGGFGLPDALAQLAVDVAR